MNTDTTTALDRATGSAIARANAEVIAATPDGGVYPGDEALAERLVAMQAAIIASAASADREAETQRALHRMNRAGIVMASAAAKDLTAQRSLKNAAFYAKATANAREATIAQHARLRAEYYAARAAQVPA